MHEVVRTKDTGTLQYEIYVNDDQSECIVLEAVARGSACHRLRQGPVAHVSAQDGHALHAACECDLTT